MGYGHRKRSHSVILSDESFHFSAPFSLLMTVFGDRNQRFIMECPLLWTITGYRAQYQQIIINHAIIYVQYGGHDGMDGTGVTSHVPSAALAFQTFAVVTDVQHNLLRAHVFPDQIQHRQLRHFPDDLPSLLKIIGTLQDLPGRNTAVDGWYCLMSATVTGFQPHAWSIIISALTPKIFRTCPC